MESKSANTKLTQRPKTVHNVTVLKQKRVGSLWVCVCAFVRAYACVCALVFASICFCCVLPCCLLVNGFG